jgi:ubiquitin carboxyl-terminal hydrolase 31
MRVAEAGLPAGTYLDPTLDHPLYMEAVDQSLALCQEDSGPAHLKLVLEWDSQAKER